MSPRARAAIDLGAIRHNLAVVRERAPGARVCAAVKANGYGHGAAAIAPALAGADMLAVAGVDEAVALREAGVSQPIVVLSDPLSERALATCVAQRLSPLVFEPGQVRRLAALQTSARPLDVWVKIDSGMHRLGFPASQAADWHARVTANSNVRLAGWITHLACADDPADPATNRQIECFDTALAGLLGARSLANSAGVCAWPASHADLVRPGIMLYGGSPLLRRSADELGLRPAMTLSAPLIARSEVAAGEAVGYGASWRAERATPVGVIAIGYGDGYPRHAPSGTPVLVGGRRVPLVGRVSMDMITVDLSACPEAAVGDTAVLWGVGLPADEVARGAGTIAYELFCRLTSRVAFEYHG